MKNLTPSQTDPEHSSLCCWNAVPIHFYWSQCSWWQNRKTVLKNSGEKTQIVYSFQGNYSVILCKFVLNALITALLVFCNAGLGFVINSIIYYILLNCIFPCMLCSCLTLLVTLLFANQLTYKLLRNLLVFWD